MALRSRKIGFFLLPALAGLLVASPAFAGWQSNVNYGGSMPADFYTPDVPPESPGVIVSLHYCGGNKGNAQPWFASLANQYGFLIITPQAGGNCFDATAAKGGERGEIVKMVEYAVSEYGADPSRVFAAGASSGACMTHALLAAYPDVFAGGSSLAGVAAGVWTGGNDYGWSVPNKSDEEWGDVVRDLNPGYTGPWPRIQIWHAEGDTNLSYSQNYPVEVAQWTNVWGITDDGTTESVQPQGASDTWSRTSYTDACGTVAVEANSVGQQVSHDLTGRGLWGDVVRFFGLDMPATTPTDCMGSTTSTGAGGASTGTSSTTGVPTDTSSSAGGTSGTTDATAGSTTGSATATSGMGGMATSGTSTTSDTSDTSGSSTTSGTSAATTTGSTVTSTSAAGPVTSSTATGGAMPPASADASDSDGGCSCRMPSGGSGVPVGSSLVGLAGLGVVMGRRRLRKPRSNPGGPAITVA